jgi:hypothetical protein
MQFNIKVAQLNSTFVTISILMILQIVAMIRSLASQMLTEVNLNSLETTLSQALMADMNLAMEIQEKMTQKKVVSPFSSLVVTRFVLMTQPKTIL